MNVPVGTYSPFAEYKGLFFFSGQIGVCPQTKELKKGLSLQLDQVFSHIDTLLEKQNLSKGHIIKTTVFLTDLKNFEVINRAYREYFKQPFPARSCVEVSALPKGALVEIEVIAGR